MLIHCCRADLREQNDQPVAVGPAGESAASREGVADFIAGLAAAMKADVDTATWLSDAGQRQIDDACLIKAVRT